MTHRNKGVQPWTKAKLKKFAVNSQVQTMAPITDQETWGKELYEKKLPQNKAPLFMTQHWRISPLPFAMLGSQSLERMP